MKAKINSNQIIIFLFLSFISFVVSQNVQIIKLNSVTRDFGGSAFDTYDSTNLRQAAIGSSKFGISAWVRKGSSALATGANKYVLHLTMVGDTNTPYDQTTLSSDSQHLSRILSVALNGQQLNVNPTNLQNKAGESITLTNQATSLDNTDKWTFFYASINIETATYYHAYEKRTGSPVSSALKTTVTLSTTSVLQEKLDERLTIYVGGTKGLANHFVGKISEPTFYVNYFSDQIPQNVIFQEVEKLFYFNVNEESSTTVAYNYFDSLFKLDKDTSSFTSDTGLVFTGTDKKANIDLLESIPDYGFLSFWIKVDSAANTEFIISSLKTTKPALISSLILRQDGTNIAFGVRTPSTSQLTSYSFPLNDWHHIVWSWSIGIYDTNSFSSITVNGVKQGFLSVNVAMPTEARDTKLHLGDPSNSFAGKLVDIYIGRGGFHEPASSINNCAVQSGLNKAYCLLCKKGFFLNDGVCVSSCPTGTYLSTVGQACRRCHKSCSECNKAGAAGCSSCKVPFPYLFQGVCHNQCPKGSVLDSISNTCKCYPSCKQCSYSLSTNLVTCLECHNNKYFITGNGDCVESRLCPFGQWGVSGSCSSTCTNYKNYATRECLTYCSTNTVKIEALKQCQMKCPTGYYQKTITTAIAIQETDQECVVCASPCATCSGPLATNCLSCLAGFLFHEYNGLCSKTCSTGFFQDREVCRVCRTNCTECPTRFNLFNSTCVENCPGFTISNGTHCIDNPVPIVRILQAPLDPRVPIKISRTSDILLNATWITKTQVTSIKWRLQGENYNLNEELFYNTFTDLPYLQIPVMNLRPTTLYNVTFEVSVSGQTGVAYVLLQTGTPITKGLLDVSPTEGISGLTEFTVNIAAWSSPEPLTFRIIAQERIEIKVRGNPLAHYRNRYIIAQNITQQGTFTFTYPFLTYDTKIIVSAIASSSTELEVSQVELKIKANGQNSTSLKTDVWKAQVNPNTTESELAGYIKGLKGLYPNTPGDTVRRIQGFNNLLTTRILQNNNRIYLCDDLVTCSGKGVCQLAATLVDPQGGFSCNCFAGFGGETCMRTAREMEIYPDLTMRILSRIQEIPVTNDSYLRIIEMLNDLSSMEDLVSKAGIRLIVNILRKFDNFQPSSYFFYTHLFTCIGNLARQKMTRSTLRSDEKSRLLSDLKTLLNNHLKVIEMNMVIDDDYLFDTNEFYVYLGKKFPRQYSSNPNDTHFTLPFASAQIVFPVSALPLNETVIFRAVEWKISASNALNNSLSSSLDFSIAKNSGPIDVSNLTAPLTVYLKKLSYFYPLSERPGNVNSGIYNCGSLDSFERFSTTGCSFVNETDGYVVCNCTHATEFAVLVNANQIRNPPSYADIKQINDDMVKDKIVQATSLSLDFDSRAENARRYSPPVEPRNERDFQFWNPGTWGALTVCVLYILCSIINYPNIIKNNIDTYLANNKGYLLMSHHPLISLTVFGWTDLCHTHQMRLTKFFTALMSHLCFTAVLFEGIEEGRDRDLHEGRRIVFSGLIGLLISYTAQYIIEGIYWVFRKCCRRGHHSSILYHLICFVVVAGFFIVTVNAIGTINRPRENEIDWLYCILLTLGVDFLIIHTVILCIVFWTYNKGRLAAFFAFQGYFVNAGSDEDSFVKKVPSDNRVHIVNERISNTKVENFEENDHERERLVN